MATQIKVFGAGCAKCKASLALIERLVSETGAQVSVTKVENMEDIIARGILSTPGIEVDGEMKIRGKVPTRTEVLGWIGAE